MSISLPACLLVTQHILSKNGKIHNGKQNYRCRDCGRQLFNQDPQNKIIDQTTKPLIDKLLLEKIPLAGIAR